MQEFAPIKEGKVREVYDNGDSLIIVATDRISAFDVILKNKITNKGAILTQMSRFWFDFTKDVVPNHMLSVDVKDMPEFFQNDRFDGNSMMCRKLEMLPIECIVRGYITEAAGQAIRRTALYAASGFRKGFRSPRSFQSRSIRRAQRLTLGCMMKIFLLREASRCLRRNIRERVRSMPER